MKIFGVHPADKDLNFLTKVNQNLTKKYYPDFKYLRLDPDHRSHEACIKELKKESDCLLFIFCHALDRSIRGCKIESEASSASGKDFSYGTLISPNQNIEIFSKKRVFCLACFSSELGQDAIKAGCEVYLGFGDIPFFITEKFKEEKVEAFLKVELASIVYNALTQAIDRKLTFNQLSTLIGILIDKKRFELMINKEAGKALRFEVAKVLSRIRNGIVLFGNGQLIVS